MTILEAIECLVRSTDSWMPEAVYTILAEADDERVDERLIEVLQNPELHEGYPLFGAIEVLSRRRSLVAAESMARLVAQFSDLDGGISDLGMRGLASMGAGAMDAVLAVVEEVGPTGHLEMAMVEWGVSDERIYRALVALPDIRPRLAAELLGRYGDARALPILHQLFDAEENVPGRYNLVLTSCALAILELGGGLTPQEKAKLEAMGSSTMSDGGQLGSLVEPHVAPKTPGRNDPCWCGSGEKYKKCHLNADRES